MEMTKLIIVGVIGLAFKIIWDWLSHKKISNGNGLIKFSDEFKKCIYGIGTKLDTNVTDIKSLENKMERLIEESTRQTTLLEVISRK